MDCYWLVHYIRSFGDSFEIHYLVGCTTPTLWFESLIFTYNAIQHDENVGLIDFLLILMTPAVHAQRNQHVVVKPLNLETNAVTNGAPVRMGPLEVQ